MLKRTATLTVDNIKLYGQLYLPGGRGNYPTVCICHGIPSGKLRDPNDGGYPAFAEKFCAEGFAAFIFNFRGTGESEGNLDMLGWTRDLETAIDYLWSLPEIDNNHLALLGFSGGAAVSIYVASRDKRVSYVAVCACPAEFDFFVEANEAQSVAEHFHSIGAIRDSRFPLSVEKWFNGFMKISPVDYVAEITPRALLIVHGDKDETVDVSQARRLYDTAGDPRQISIIDGAGHRLRQDERTLDIVLKWLKSRYQA